MRRERTFKKTLLFLAIMSIMIFAMSITASAAATNIKQTEGTNSYVEISWDSSNGRADRYKVYYSTSENGKYTAVTDYTSSSTSKMIRDLNAGSTYYIKVASYSSYNSPTAYNVSAPVQVVTAPISVNSDSILQTAGTPSSFTIGWSKVVGATGYIVTKDSGSSKASKKVSTNKAAIKATAGNRYNVDVVAYRKAPKTGFVAKSYSSTGYGMKPSPSTPMYFADATKGGLEWTPKSTSRAYPTLYWTVNPNDKTSPDGYQIEIYTVDGKKKITTAKTTSRRISIASASSNKLIKNKGFKARIRAYIKNDKATCVSKWSAMRTVIPQASIKITASSHTSARVTWPKVVNATNYIIYVSRDSGYSDSGHWAKKKLSASTTSYNITGLKKWKNFGVYVIPVVKVNGKAYKAYKTWYTYTYVY